VTVCGQVVTGGEREGYWKKRIFTVAVNDGSGTIFATFFNQPYLKETFRPGMKVILSGRVDIYQGVKQIVHPAFEVVNGRRNLMEAGRIVALYRLPEGISQRSFHKIMKEAVKMGKERLPEVIPFAVRQKLNLGSLRYALSNIHFPVTFTDLKKAREYLIFEEFFLLTTSLLRRRMLSFLPPVAPALEKGSEKPPEEVIAHFQKLVPFPLTESQQTALKEIIEDLQKPYPMHRLLTGEVGSGKTLVAAGAVFYTVLAGGQAALLAPTEILAEQHFMNLQRIFVRSGWEMALLVRAVSRKEKERIKEGLAAGKVNFVVGTHSLLSEEISFSSLLLAIIDEEHKFGVNQRDLLGEKGKGVHVLLMSATPIPRTLALTIYGGLSLSSLSEERGKRQVATFLFRREEREAAYRLFDNLIQKGRTGYLVTSRLNEGRGLVGARQLFQEISSRFPHWQPALIYGSLPLAEKEKVVTGFREGRYRVLVATSVVEVGLDLPEANILLIEDAEHFGLAQLHQMRGRIGRKFQDALCLVIGNPSSQTALERLNRFASVSLAQQLSEDDLILRGEGEVLGARQHGLPPLRIANLRRDLSLLQAARKEAEKILKLDPSLSGYPELRERMEEQDLWPSL